MIRRPPRSTHCISSAASDVYKRQVHGIINNQMYNPIREGCRGGRDLFKWNDVRLMPAKDRECYLGSSVKLGYLDRGGRWRKKDWWQNYDPSGGDKAKSERAEIKAKELQAYKEKLGLVKPKVESAAVPAKELTPLEMQEILSRRYDNDEATKADRIKGLGFEKKLGNYRNREADNPAAVDPSLNRLEGLGVNTGQAKKEVHKEREKRDESTGRKRSRSREHRDRYHKHKHKHH
eukprot:TRINITY_DN9751_c0_g1_i7.p1 TRINITY_DN9751_c0_g1~~TRINITY_DN9751_c0_g1_i7.p1  ORF type:complete len:242 (+),score=77.16 TRINITY_DN9751_c0_g1_i7:25-726(+)